jgi:N-ethylmaleimide reductase
MNDILLNPFSSEYLGSMKTRVVMSAMSRSFAGPNHTCTDDIAAYYERRANDGVALILTEGIIIHRLADGYNNVPHLETKEQAETWKDTIRTINNSGSKIFAQLWHCGRISHPDYTGGEPIVSSSNIQAGGINRQNGKPYGVPRALELSEIPQIYNMYINAADNAFFAGFNGIEIHMGHGYLIDQFFDSRINNRTDAYGGCVENRCRIAVELIAKLIERYSSNKVMIRISPSRYMGGLYEWPNLDEMLEYFIPKISDVGLRLLDISCANADYYQTSGKIIRMIRKNWSHFLIGGASLRPEKATQEIKEGLLDMVTWGRYILANPDFVSRIRAGEELREITDEIRSILY